MLQRDKFCFFLTILPHPFQLPTPTPKSVTGWYIGTSYSITSRLAALAQPGAGLPIAADQSTAIIESVDKIFPYPGEIEHCLMAGQWKDSIRITPGPVLAPSPSKIVNLRRQWIESILTPFSREWELRQGAEKPAGTFGGVLWLASRMVHQMAVTCAINTWHDPGWPGCPSNALVARQPEKNGQVQEPGALLIFLKKILIYKRAYLTYPVSCNLMLMPHG